MRNTILTLLRHEGYILWCSLVFMFGVMTCQSLSHRSQVTVDHLGKPLYLTPYLVKGNVKAARERSRVGSIAGSPDLESYSGFMTVREQLKNNLFFWFFPAIKRRKEVAPVVLWLQGGPGTPSTFGLLLEHGPLQFSIGDNSASFREYTWVNNISMLYLDQPVGTGYSHSSTNGYSKTVADTAADLYEFLGQFYVLFPELRANDFYIAGEGYAGKFIVALAMMMNMMKDDDSLPKLRGLLLGNVYIDPETQNDLSDYYYQLGLMNKYQAEYMRTRVEQVVRLFYKRKFTDAQLIMDELIDRGHTGKPTLFWNATGLRQDYNVDLTSSPPEFSAYASFLTRPEVRLALHVGTLPFRDNDIVRENMYGDLISSQKRTYTTILDSGIRVLMYSGQKDLSVPFCTTQKLMESVHWKGEKEYKGAIRRPWRAGLSNIIGYYLTVRNYTEVLLRGAGHVVPFDQPIEAFVLVNRFVLGQPINELD
ncbi:probable serine carboxypeptidase CPVL [Ornithodoros turicata]